MLHDGCLKGKCSKDFVNKSSRVPEGSFEDTCYDMIQEMNQEASNHRLLLLFVNLLVGSIGLNLICKKMKLS